jgi:hypothetical protein
MNPASAARLMPAKFPAGQGKYPQKSLTRTGFITKTRVLSYAYEANRRGLGAPAGKWQGNWQSAPSVFSINALG